jgi:hypothetical protein
VHTREFPFGNATVFYPEATEDGGTAAVLLDVDPVGMVRGRGGKGGAEDQYTSRRTTTSSTSRTCEASASSQHGCTGT